MLNFLKKQNQISFYYYQSILFLNNFNLKFFKKINNFFLQANFVKPFNNLTLKKKKFINSTYLFLQKKKLNFNSAYGLSPLHLLNFLTFLKKVKKKVYIVHLKKIKKGYSCGFLGLTAFIPLSMYSKYTSKGFLNNFFVNIQKSKKLQTKHLKKNYKSFFLFFKKQLGKNILLYLQKNILSKAKIRTIFHLSSFKYLLIARLNLKRNIDLKYNFFPFKNPLSKTKWRKFIKLKQKPFILKLNEI